MKRFIADILISILRKFNSIQWKYKIISWGYGEQSNHAWEKP